MEPSALQETDNNSHQEPEKMVSIIDSSTTSRIFYKNNITHNQILGIQESMDNLRDLYEYRKQHWEQQTKPVKTRPPTPYTANNVDDIFRTIDLTLSRSSSKSQTPPPASPSRYSSSSSSSSSSESTTTTTTTDNSNHHHNCEAYIIQHAAANQTAVIYTALVGGGIRF